jgi:RNA polymerase sigma-70 factor, ECF subfamily
MAGTEATFSDDGQLVEAARAGDAAALNAIITRHQSRVFRFALKMCRRNEDAEDVLQETLLAAARSLKDYRGEASLATWLYTIARSFCIKKRRQSKFAPAHVVSLDSDEAKPALKIPDSASPPDQALEEREIATELGRAVDALEPAYRDVLVLRDIEGLPAAEVAEVMGLTVEAVKSRLHRARSRVRAALAPFLGLADAAPRPRRCPDIVDLFSRHLEGDIDAAVCARMEKHLAGCSRCEGACESLRETLRLCRATPAPRVPAPLQASIRSKIRSMVPGPGGPAQGRRRTPGRSRRA